jgi:hypothetical protein
MRAEASDWFWWFGKGHSSIHEREFDYLFRQNLRMVYERVGVQPPDTLDRPVDPGNADVPIVAPTAFISPRITGRREGYYKWVGSGSCEFSNGSIHRLQPVVSGVRFGFDERSFYLRCDGFEDLSLTLADRGWVRVQFVLPCESAVLLVREGDRWAVRRATDAGPGDVVPGAEAAIHDLLELSLPFDFFDPFTARPLQVEFYVVIGNGSLEVERFPWDSVIGMDFDPEEFASANWFV